MIINHIPIIIVIIFHEDYPISHFIFWMYRFLTLFPLQNLESIKKIRIVIYQVIYRTFFSGYTEKNWLVLHDANKVFLVFSRFK